MDNGYTPYIAAKVNSQTCVPTEYVKNGEITLNISHKAVDNFVIGNDLINFKARFGGVTKSIQIPICVIKGIFAKEINQGLSFVLDNEQAIEAKQDTNKPISSSQKKQTNNGKPHLQLIK
jgi:stringent starvation protein B